MREFYIGNVPAWNVRIHCVEGIGRRNGGRTVVEEAKKVPKKGVITKTD